MGSVGKNEQPKIMTKSMREIATVSGKKCKFIGVIWNESTRLNVHGKKCLSTQRMKWKYVKRSMGEEW